MKSLLKKYGVVVLGVTTLIFLIWTFFLGGMDTLTQLPIEVPFVALLLIVGVIFFLFTWKLISSIKWWKVSETWRKDIKIGDVAYVSTYEGHEDAEVTDIEDEYVTVKVRVHKSRIYKPH